MTPQMWTCRYVDDAAVEREALVPREKAALINAEAKLSALGPHLPYPHSSVVRAADRLRELRPRGGSSPWRALYRQIEASLQLVPLGRKLRSTGTVSSPLAAGPKPGWPRSRERHDGEADGSIEDRRPTSG